MNLGLTQEPVLKVWKGKILRTPQQASLADLSSGLKSSAARGPRCDLVYTANEIGFLPSLEIIFLCKTNTADERDRTDGQIFEPNSREEFLRNLPPN
jgi:hypothetical protein